MNAGSLHPTLLAILLKLCGMQISKGACKGKILWSFNRRSLLRHLAKHTTLHNANSSTPPMSFPQNAERTKTMKEKNTGERWRMLRPGDAPEGASPGPASCPWRLTLHCIASTIVSMQRVFPTHCKPKTRHKNACTPLPRPGDALFDSSPGLAYGNSFWVAHCRPQCVENRAI